jgi:hypothetical protein
MRIILFLVTQDPFKGPRRSGDEKTVIFSELCVYYIEKDRSTRLFEYVSMVTLFFFGAFPFCP